MPFVFLAAVAVATAYFLRARQPSTACLPVGVCAPAATRVDHEARATPVGVRGWLLVYVIGLAAELAHGLALTIGSLVIYADPSLAGLHSFIPLWALSIYVVSNVGLVAYGMFLFVWMSRGRRTAITHNLLFNALSIAFLILWFCLSAKSPIGTVADSLPGLAAIAYFSRSRRVRDTFTR